MHIFFTGNNHMLWSFIRALSWRVETRVLHNTLLPQPELGSAHVDLLRYRTFGLAPIMRLLHSETSVPTYAQGLERILDETRPDKIVILDFHKFSFAQCVRYKRRNPACKLYLYSNTRRWPRNPIAHLAMMPFWWYAKAHLKDIEKVLVFTDIGKSWWQKRAPQMPIEVCAPAVDTDLFYPEPSKEFMADGTLRLLMNARFVAYKRHEDVLEAMSILRTKGIRVELSCIGRGGHQAARVARRAEDMGLGDVVHILPQVPLAKMRDLCVAHDALILPSVDEELGLAVPEAMACGIPTITSDTVGANVYVEDGVTGRIFRTKDVHDLVAQIELMRDPHVLKQMGEAACEKIESRFSEKDAGERFLSVLG